MNRSPRRAALVRLLIVLLILSMTLPLFLVRCGGCDRRPDVVIWHSFAPDGNDDRILRSVLSQIAAEQPSISLEVRALGEDLGTALAEGISQRQLPDILIAPAEWAPTLDRAQLLFRVPLEEGDDWLPAVTAALARDGQLLGLPLFCSTIALARTARLAGGAWPSSVKVLAASADAAAESGAGELYWPFSDAYYTLPWFLAAGGRLEPPAPPGNNPPWDEPSEVDAAAAGAWLGSVGTLADAVGADRRAAAPLQAWREGEVSFAPVTPQEWVLARAVSVAADLGPLPGGVPFMSTWAAMLPRLQTQAEAATKAVELLIRLRTSNDDGLLYVAGAMGMLPVLGRHFESEVMAANGLNLFAAVVAEAEAMPAGRFAAEVWAAYESALAEFLSGAKAEEVINRLMVGVATLTGGSQP